ELEKGEPALNNHMEVNMVIEQSINEMYPEMEVQWEPFGLGGEDFGYMTEKIPGAMFFLGCAIEDEEDRSLHKPLFGIDETCLPIGTAIFVKTVNRFLNKEESTHPLDRNSIQRGAWISMMITTEGKKMFIGGKWLDRKENMEVRDPQDNSLITTVPKASAEDVLNTVKLAEEGAAIAAKIPVHERISILNKAADYIEKYADLFANTIASEGSKTIREANGEVNRCVETIRLSAEEARRINGETIPFDQMPGSENRVGYYYHVPIGIVAAITPFNDPLNLVAHKIGPAIASGNAIIVKPATLTPLSALLLAEAFDHAGLPEKVLSVITGKGSEIGDVLVTHPSVRMVSFTGGLDTGESIAKKAGLKKIAMELGSNSPSIVLEDADIDEAVDSTVAGAFGAVGQNCLGVQRIFVQENIYKRFKQQFVAKASQYKMGDKKDESTDMGPLISEKAAKRVEKWVDEAVKEGAN